MDEFNARIDDRLVTLMITPASCRCGGSHMWIIQRPSGAFMSLGCICHTNLEFMLDKYKEEIA